MAGLRTPELDSPPLRRYGLPQLVYGAQPAAGAAFTVRTDGNYYTRLVSVYASLDTDSNVAERELVLEYLDAAGAVYHVCGAPVTVSEDEVAPYVFSAFLDSAAWPVNSTILVPLAPIILGPMHSWRLTIVAVEAGDQLSAIRYVQEQFYSDVEL